LITRRQLKMLMVAFIPYIDLMVAFIPKIALMATIRWPTAVLATAVARSRGLHSVLAPSWIGAGAA